MSLSKRLATIVALGLATVALQGQGPQPPDMPKGWVLHTIADGKLYWIETNVANMGVIIGNTGVILFDAGSNGKDLADTVAKITNKPITTVIESHDDTDHINGLYGLPGSDKLKIIAMENNWKQQWTTGRWIDHPKANCPKSPMPPAPNVIIRNDKVDTTIDGVHFIFYHFAPAHTGHDLIAYLPDYKVAFIGDIVMDKNLFHTDPLPGQDHNMFWKSEKQGTPLGMFKNVDELLKLPVTGYISGHSAHLMTKADIAQVRDEVKADYDKVAQMARDGKSEAEAEVAMGEDKYAPRGGCISYVTLPWFAWNETMRDREELK